MSGWNLGQQPNMGTCKGIDWHWERQTWNILPIPQWRIRSIMHKTMSIFKFATNIQEIAQEKQQAKETTPTHISMQIFLLHRYPEVLEKLPR